MGRALEVNGGALSLEDWNYIRGLFLADGCFFTRKIRRVRRIYGAQFCLGRNEENIARKLAKKFSQLGLNPRVRKIPHANMLRLTVCSRALRLFLPNKAVLRDDASERRNFFDRNRLLGVKFGIPFFAGLLDGDGRCGVQVVQDRTFFPQINSWMWSFSQSRYIFLVDYVKEFVESLTPKSTRTWVRANTGVVTIVLRKCGIETLLKAGITKYSWRVTQWLKRVADFQSKNERLKYYTSGEVMQMLNAGYGVLRRWVKAGRIRCVRRTNKTKGRLNGSNFYFPVSEVMKLKDEFLSNQQGVARIRKLSVKLVDASRVLGVSYESLRSQYRRGKLHAFLVHDERTLGGRYLAIPECQVEILKRRYAGGKKRRGGGDISIR
jgi:hypothetical protein